MTQQSQVEQNQEQVTGEFERVCSVNCVGWVPAVAAVGALISVVAAFGDHFVVCCRTALDVERE